MNHSKSLKQSNNCRFESNTAEEDFQKLMDICNSYGLNEQQTNQLIDEFKKGALFSPDKSLNDSLNQSLSQQYTEKQQEQEYSFKHQKQSFQQSNRFQQSNFHHQESKKYNQTTERVSNQSKSQFREDPKFSFQHLERILMEKFTIQKGLVNNLEEQNRRLKGELQQKQRQIARFTQMKGKQTDIVIGLKDIISNLTNALKEKEVSYREIQQKYNNMMETRVKQLSSKRSLTQFSQHQLQDITNNYQNSVRESSCHKKSAKTVKQSWEQQKQNKQDHFYDKKRGNRIDVKKYKEMIQNLRGNC